MGYGGETVIRIVMLANISAHGVVAQLEKYLQTVGSKREFWKSRLTTAYFWFLAA